MASPVMSALGKILGSSAPWIANALFSRGTRLATRQNVETLAHRAASHGIARHINGIWRRWRLRVRVHHVHRPFLTVLRFFVFYFELFASDTPKDSEHRRRTVNLPSACLGLASGGTVIATEPQILTGGIIWIILNNSSGCKCNEIRMKSGWNIRMKSGWNVDTVILNNWEHETSLEITRIMFLSAAKSPLRHPTLPQVLVEIDHEILQRSGTSGLLWHLRCRNRETVRWCSM